jgi:hypothetical protein
MYVRKNTEYRSPTGEDHRRTRRAGQPRHPQPCLFEIGDRNLSQFVGRGLAAALVTVHLDAPRLGSASLALHVISALANVFFYRKAQLADIERSLI